MFNMRIFTILSVIAVIFVLIGSVSAADIHANDTQTQSASDNDEIVSVENDLDELSTNPSTYSNLSNEISSGEKYMELNHDYYTYDYGSTIEITASDSVIDGKGATIDMAKSKIQAFKVTASGVTIKNLTIKNVNYDRSGAIYFSSSGTVINCNLDGGIFFGGYGTVINCNFVNNTNYGSTISFGGSGTVTNCNFTNHNAGSYDGGAIHFGTSGAVTNCNFINNKATLGNGGAIHFGTSGSVKNCNFTNNSAPLGNGGAIYFHNTGIAENCKFADNLANVGGAVSFSTNGELTNCNFTNNAAIAFFGPYGNDYQYTRDDLMSDYDWTYGNGGAVNFMDNGVVTNCNFDNNFGTGSAGGAIYFYSSGTVENCNFTDNNVKQYFDGGAIYFNGSGYVENCNFIGNIAFCANGGAIYFHSPGTVENCNFTNNQASNDGVLSLGNGGAVYFYDSGSVTNSNFIDNKAVTGSAIHFNTISSINAVSNSLFLNNMANADGLQVVQYGDKFEISFTGNDNLINAIYSSGDVSFTNVTYWGANGITNTNTYTPSRSNREVGQNITVTVVVNDILVLNVTKITDEDGKIVLGKLDNGIYTITARHYADSYYTQVETTETVVIGNTYSDLANEIRSGGNITLKHDYYSYDQGPVISIYTPDSVIDGNGAIIDMAGLPMCALKVSASNVTIKNLTIKNANYNKDGGAIYFSSSGTVENCIFVNNAAKCGGAIYFSSSGAVLNCNFINNTAKCGGAICFYSSSGTNNISNSSFLNNNLHAEDNALLQIVQNEGKLEISFMGQDNLLNAIYSNGVVNFSNVTYWDVEGIANTGNSFIAPSPSNNGADLNITVIVVANEDIILNTTKVTDKNGKIVLDELVGGIYTITAYHYADSHYAQVETTETVVVGNTYSDLSYEIGSGGNIILKHDYYIYDHGPVISIATPGSVIDGNGAIIDMVGSDIRALKVDASNVTIKNLTIKNANYNNSVGGAIYFNSSGSVENCNFINNSVTYIYVGATGLIRYEGANYFSTYGGAIYFRGKGNVTNCSFINNSASYGGAISLGGGNVTNCIFVNNKATDSYGYGGAIYFRGRGNVTNCSFINNSAYQEGGAIDFASSYTCTVTNCNFVNNNAARGGSVYIKSKGEVTNCSFTNNSANRGGAIYCELSNEIEVTNCNFTGNNAITGSAIYFPKYGGTITISNSLFLNNRANVDDNNPLQMVQNGNKIEIAFMGQDNLLNAIHAAYGYVRFTNVTYWGVNGIANTGSSTISGSQMEVGQNITVIVVVNDDIVLNATKVTDSNGKIVLEEVIKDNYLIMACHDEDSYYTQAKIIKTNMGVSVTPITTNNKTVNITAKSNIRNDVIRGKLLFVIPNGTEISASYNADGTWWAVYTFDDYGDYNVNASYIGGEGIVINNALISIKNDVPINVNDVSIVFGDVANVVVGVPEAINGQNISITVNETSKNTTIEYGKANAVFLDLPVGEYVISVDYLGDVVNSANSTNAKLTVNKVNSTLTVDNVVLDYGETTEVTVATDGATHIIAKIDNREAAVNGNTIIIPVLDVGNYTLTVTTIPDSNHYAVTKTANLMVIRVNNTKTNGTSENVTDNTNSTNSSDTSDTVKPEMIIPQLDEISSDGSIPVTLPSDATGTVILTVNGMDYNFDVSNGVANVKLPELANGDYPYTITYSGDSKYSSFNNEGSLKVNKTTANPVKNETNATVVDDSKILASNKKVIYATGKYYTIKVYGKDGQFANGVKVVITVNGKTFKKLTTKEGVAKFKATQKPGTYKMVISALNNNITKTLTVKHLIKLKSATVKKSAKKLVLQASLGKVNGKYLKGKTITFKFKGKVVGKVKTDKKGVAKVTIKSSILKKLKVGKKITYQATYNKDTIKKTVKVKK
ncbi:right-handed parallel beta-helix repeat-containing protein [Methanobrevibacter sp.]|uniref:right-handed parallel beta-helix repeat-containing protein n=1 Tax=Methanobrevibacter sp. TaxID=66852 RepID=UPI00386E64C7